MSKALPWNIRGIGSDAREAARDAARREGLSLGEWLQDAIADGVDPAAARRNPQGSTATDAHDRIDAITARLERLGTAAARPRGRIVERDRRLRDDRTPSGFADDDTASARQRRRIVDDEVRRRDTRRANTEDDVVDAVAAMEARARQSDRRTEDAFASVTRYLESIEARRAREQAGVATLSERLSDIETRLATRDPDPIKGALARLEARLEQIGLRREAEADAARSGPVPVDRLEQKLNAVLAALTPRLDANPAPPRVVVSRKPEKTSSPRLLGGYWTMAVCE